MAQPKTTNARTLDLLIRYQTDGSSSTLHVGRTSDLRQPLEVLVSDCRSLGEALESLHRNVEYQSAFMAHQMGEMSEADFEALTVEFAAETVRTKPEDLAKKVSALVRWTKKIAITREEVATMFNVSEDMVDAMMAFVGDIDAYASKQLQAKGVSAWQPTGTLLKQTSSS